MSRRRKKNTLLPKMIGIAVVINAVLLPLLAHFGAFKAIHGQHLTPVKLVQLPPPPKRPPVKKPPVKRKVARAKPRPATHIARTPATSRPSRPNPNQPKLVAAGGGAGSGPAIENNGTGKAGQLPTAPVPTPVPVPTPATSAPTPPPAVTPPVPAPPKVAAAPTPPPAPVVVAAEPLSQPRPTLPDDLSVDDIHNDFEALFVISKDGTATAKMLASTGDSRLDTLALDAARRWTFRPATVNGQPVDSYRRLRIEFYAL